MFFFGTNYLNQYLTPMSNKHIWDYPKDKISAICKECGIQRFKEKYLGRFCWVYYQNYNGIPIFKLPKCNKQQNNNQKNQ